MFEPIPGLSLLQSYRPVPTHHPITQLPSTIPVSIRHSASALVTVALSCAFGLRATTVLRPKLYSAQVRRHINARLRQGGVPTRGHLHIDSFHFNLRNDPDDTSITLIDVYGSLSIGDHHQAYTAQIEQPADQALKMRSLRVV